MFFPPRSSFWCLVADKTKLVSNAQYSLISDSLSSSVHKICNRRPLVGAVGAYKRGDARRKDSDLCFAHSRVLRTFTCTSLIHLRFAHSLVLHTFSCAPHIHLCHIHLCFAHSLVLFLSRPVFSCQSESPSFSWLLWAGQQTLLDG